MGASYNGLPACSPFDFPAIGAQGTREFHCRLPMDSCSVTWNDGSDVGMIRGRVRYANVAALEPGIIDTGLLTFNQCPRFG